MRYEGKITVKQFKTDQKTFDLLKSFVDKNENSFSLTASRIQDGAVIQLNIEFWNLKSLGKVHELERIIEG